MQYSESPLRLKVNAQVVQEHLDYVENVKKLTTDDVIARSYPLAVKEEISICFANTTFPDSTYLELLEERNILDSVYAVWLRNDYSTNEILEQTIEDCIA